MTLIIVSVEYCNNYDTIDDEWRKIRNWMLPTDANSDYDNSALDGKNWFLFPEEIEMCIANEFSRL